MLRTKGLDEVATALPDDVSAEIGCDQRNREFASRMGAPIERTVSVSEGVTFRHETDGFGRTSVKFFRDGKVVGSADVRDFGHSIQITNFQVARGARRQGIGTAFQFHIEARFGKGSVPDAMLSKAEYRRWKKIDPVAVQDYVKGTKSYTPRMGSTAYFAALGGRPVPGSRAAQNLPVRSASARSERAPDKSPRKRYGSAVKARRSRP